MNEFVYGSCMALLEDRLPENLLLEVLKYLKNDTVESGKHLSQVDRVWNHLLEHGEITNMQCHSLYGIRHCPSVIRDIKKKIKRENLPYILDTRKTTGANRYGEKTEWLIYFIRPIGEEGQCRLFI